MFDREYKEYTNPDGLTWREYKLDPVIANRIKELFLGLNGCRMHSFRALSIEVTGIENQMMGSDLVKLAEWTLGEDWEG